MQISSPEHRPAGHRPAGAQKTPARCTRLLITFSGEVDCSNVDRIAVEMFRKVRRAPPSARVVVDCAGLTFVDSLGLHLMGRLQQRADAADVLLTWRNVNAHVRTLLKFLALDQIVRLEPPTLA